GGEKNPIGPAARGVSRAKVGGGSRQAGDVGRKAKIRGCERQRATGRARRLLRARCPTGQAARREMRRRYLGAGIEDGSCGRRYADQTELGGAVGPRRCAARY